MSRLSAAGLGCAVLILCAGCGGSDEIPMGSASGTVTFKGEPIKDGMLWIYNRDTSDANQAEIHNGKFEFPGEVRAGTYTAYVTPIPPAPGSPFDPVKMVGTGGFPAGVPEKYQREDLSDLKIEIVEGHSEVELVIPES